MVFLRRDFFFHIGRFCPEGGNRVLVDPNLHNHIEYRALRGGLSTGEKVFKKYSKMKLQMKRDALEKLNWHTNESGKDSSQSQTEGFGRVGQRIGESAGRPIKQLFCIRRRFGRGGVIRTHDPLRPRRMKKKPQKQLVFNYLQ